MKHDHDAPASPSSASRAPRVLVVDDDASMAEMLADGLAARGFDAVALHSSGEAARRIEKESFDALVTDLRMPEKDGMSLLAIARKAQPARPVIVMTAYSAVDTAIESIRQGAYHYLTKPFKVEELALFLSRALDDARVRREAATLRKALRDRFDIANVVGRSAAIEEVYDLVARVADADAPVLVVGETGTGKGLVARAIHAQGARAKGPFVAINCAALPETLLESELFGHVKGAFTGATSTRIGLLEEADGGTLFLDEIGEMPAALQAKLLGVLESGDVRAVGANRTRKVDVRFVAATHRDLRALVSRGTFREDLLYRLDVVTIELPALRLRKDDIPLLVDHFLSQSKSKHPRSPVVRFAQGAAERLLAHSWPGNVRELEHVIERVVLLGRSADVTATDLPPTLGAVPSKSAAATFDGDVTPMRAMQRRYAQWAYEKLGGKKLVTAEKLGVDVKTLAKLLQEKDEPEEPGVA